MDTEFGLDIVPWLKTDLLSGFSDLLDNDKFTDGDLPKNAATLGTCDLFGTPAPASNIDLSTDQATHADWLKSLMAGVAPVQPSKEDVHHASETQPFAGFPAAGMLTSIPTSSVTNPISAPMSCSRLADDSALPAPSSWDSNLSGISLESTLVDLPAVPDPCDTLGRKLKSENSFAACSELDSMTDSLCQELCKDELPTPAINSRPTRESVTTAKASLADRNRERQQRFRQRQKAKIETLENQVTRLTAQTRSLTAEKEDLSGRAAKLADLLQARDRALLNLTSQLSNMRCSGDTADTREPMQLTLTYCSPPLILNSAQLQKMTGQDLAKLWKEYMWQLSQLLQKEESCNAQWTPTTERLDALTSELVQLMMHLWDSCPEFARIKAIGLVDEGQKPDDQCYGRWQLVANSLALNGDQIQSLIALRNSLRIRLRQIWTQRREMHSSMLTCMEEDLASSRDIALQHLKVKENREALDEGLKQEGLLARDFEFAFFKKVLRPEQRAICMARSFPYFPDCQALANWVAASHGDQEAHGMMTMHTTSSTTSYHSNN